MANRPLSTPGGLPVHLRKHVAVTEAGCWSWFGPANADGSPIVICNGITYLSADLAYEWAIASIPPGFKLNHDCGHNDCLNPDHMALVAAGKAPMDYQERATLLLDDPATSAWLKAAIRALMARDPLDAEIDATLLCEIMGERAESVLRQGEDS